MESETHPGTWRFQYIEGDIRSAPPEEDKFDFDLLKEWINEHGKHLALEDVLAKYFKVQFVEEGDTYRVTGVLGGPQTEGSGRKAFEDWSSKRGKRVDWNDARFHSTGTQ
jgi:hypothetical protein